MYGRQAKLAIDFNLDEDYDPDKKLEQPLAVATLQKKQ